MKIPVLKNTLTNYMNIVMRALEGILITRWIINGLGMEYYGMWSLLWSLFVYGLLLDFGCGITAQKYTSSGIYRNEPKKYNRIISTVFTFHSLMAIVILLIAVAGSFYTCVIFNINPLQEPEKLEYAKTCFLICGIGTALTFPTGVFPEIIVGLHRIYLRNYVTVIMRIFELVGVAIVLFTGGNLAALAVLILCVTFFSNIILYFCIKKIIPTFRLRLFFDRHLSKEIFSFSGYLFLSSLSRLIMNKSNRWIIGGFCGIETVGQFHASSKMGDLCWQAAGQYQENVGPIVSALHKRKRFDALSSIVVSSIRWNTILAFFLMLCAYLLMPEALFCLFKISDPYIVSLSRLFLFPMFIGITLSNIPYSFMIMSNHHKFATYMTFGEAILNLLCNIVFLSKFGLKWGCEGVIWIHLIIRFIVCCFIFLPFMLVKLRINVFYFIRRVFGAPFLAGIPVTLYILMLNPFFSEFPWLYGIIGGSGALVLYAGVILLFEPKNVRTKLIGKIRKIIS